MEYFLKLEQVHCTQVHLPLNCNLDEGKAFNNITLSLDLYHQQENLPKFG
jgi:hypothetical protein